MHPIKDERMNLLFTSAGRRVVLINLFRQALEIWLRELPAIPLVQWYHRIPHNQTYWADWPSAENPYIHTAYWHRTFLLVLLGLKPAR